MIAFVRIKGGDLLMALTATSSALKLCYNEIRDRYQMVTKCLPSRGYASRTIKFGAMLWVLGF
ncbi:hypothetical protein VCR4J5_780050 [Vibrio crassostreae]|uniref:Uncharacterized protein n=1 Tax=Vibrio crassostreae TaxID=246167 RepID=A0ABM9QZK5_9VIBR|nr:hypothetical protein VCR19J5_230452 [Vibrio crassostreae]CDT66411.1 hypothetical protein VCR4J5_780050 [Vibrio crassostreae]